MKVILLEDVKSLGKKGQLVDVSDGYARNFILAKKLGLEATSKNMNDLKLQKAHEDKLAAERLAEAKAFAEDLKKVEVTLSIKPQFEAGSCLVPSLPKRSHRQQKSSSTWILIRKNWYCRIQSKLSERRWYRSNCTHR